VIKLLIDFDNINQLMYIYIYLMICLTL